MAPDPKRFFPGADLSFLAPSDGGSILGGKPKCLWHSTETAELPSYSDGFFPNMTICKGKPFQHIPADRAARALRNPDGGVQTNRWNVFQVEVCGKANNLAFVSVMQEVADWLHEVRGTPKTCTVEFKPHPSSFGIKSAVRLSSEAWTVYSGHLGHMHAPENDHGDPGLPFPIDLILGRGDDMTEAQEAKLDRILSVLTVTGSTGPEQTIELLFSRVRDLDRNVDQLINDMQKVKTKLQIP